MKAVVFAAGIGSRLKPFTDSHPKALVPLGGEPALGLVIRKLVAAGADGVVVNIHHFPNQIRDFLKQNDFGVPVETSDETDLLLDTAGGLAKIARESHLLSGCKEGEPILVHNADIWTDFPIGEMVEFHHSNNADATLLVDPTRKSTRSFFFDQAERLRGWSNISTGQVKPAGIDLQGMSGKAFGGVHIITPKMLKEISNAVGELHPMGIVDLYTSLCTRLLITGYTPTAPFHWHDLGTPEKLAAAIAEFNDLKK